MKKRVVILSGAGMSAESGIKTFRDADGLWEGHDVMEVASPQGWTKNRELVLDFYNQRRAQLKEVAPNAGHLAVSALEDRFDLRIITQNVDDLHERAGSKNVLHLHGELRKVRSTLDPSLIYDWEDDLHLGNKCEKGSQLRPHIVWFGEAVPMMDRAILEISEAEVAVIIGTSLQVYPAAGLIAYAPLSCEIYYIDPKPFISHELKTRKHTVIESIASEGMHQLTEILN